MNKPSFLTESFGRRSLSIVLAMILLPIITVSKVAPSQDNEGSERREAIRRIVQTYIQTGQEEYAKGFFEQASKTFQMAQGYEEYLTVAVREQLGGFLEKSQIAVLKRKRALETFRAVNDLIKRDQLIEAKTYLEKIKDNEFLTKNELKQIAEVFRQIDAQVLAAKARVEKPESQKLSVEKKPAAPAVVKKPVVSPDKRQKEISELWTRSIGLYHTGQLEKAREGFVKIVSSDLTPQLMRRTAKSYLSQIPKRKLVRESNKNVIMAVVNPEVSEAESLGVARKVASPVTGQSSYIDVINRKRNIIRSHTRAVVTDAVAKSGDFISKAEFDKAKNVVETAALTVNKNQMHLGDELFKEYSSRVKPSV